MIKFYLLTKEIACLDKKTTLYYSKCMFKTRYIIPIFFCLALLIPLGLGFVFGALVGLTRNTINTEQFIEFTTALPTKLLDINGELITEFASDEKREIISLTDVPQHLIDALSTREDNIFFKHSGFSLKAIFRAIIGVITRRSLGGGSTLTQQIAGTLYLDRTEISITRKIKELWWAIQMERRFSKQEILELYLNKVYLGGGTYGVNAASKYYFGHGVKEITPAESAILVIQLSNPAYYNPFEYPNRAMDRQQYVLEEMAKAGFLSKNEADKTFEDFWAAFDYTRINTSAFLMRKDKAPWFSEFARKELEKMMYGSMDVYTDGYTVHTTMNMKHQLAAQDIMTKYIALANSTYQRSSNSKSLVATKTYVPMTELLSLVFNIPPLKVSEQRNEAHTLNTYKKELNPVLDVLSMMLGIETLKVGIVNRSTALNQKDSKKTTVEGTMIALENSTGYITALVGGSEFGPNNQFIRAVQSKIQPGSSFKPLYYTAAIDSKKFTATSILYDSPTSFENADGTPYIPQNHLGLWQGPVQLWYALATSMNIPSLKVLQGIGFDAAIEQSSALLGIPQDELAERNFERVYPLGLGVCSVRPVEMARAFAIFANQGKEVVPLAIRSVEDKNGKIILEPEKELRIAQAEKGAGTQIISPQTAYIMTDLLTNTVKIGTLRRPSNWGQKFKYTNEQGKEYILPAGGKTGTTQNWADAWAVGFTPYYTSVFWFGFDEPGQSLGTDLTGSTLSGWAWAEFMRIANEDVPYKNFTRPATGLVEATVCSVSGNILTPACGSHRTTKIFLEGTEPTAVCEFHTNRERAQVIGVDRLASEFKQSGIENPFITKVNDEPLTLDLSFLKNNTIVDELNDKQDAQSTEITQENKNNDESEKMPDINLLPESNDLFN